MNYYYNKSYCTGFLIFILLNVSSILQAQENLIPQLRSSIQDDIKKDWLKQVKPSLSPPGSSRYLKTPNNKAFQGEDLTGIGKIYKNGIDWEAFDDKYQVNPLAITYNSSVPINERPAGSVTFIFTGGRWMWTSNAGERVTPSGVDLSGGGRKKMSPKAKQILQYVFGMEVEE